MAYIRGVCAVTLDNPDADGMVAANGHGWGRTWRFRGKDEDPYARDAAMEPEWSYAPGNTEYIAEVRGCAPRGAAPKVDMSLGNWTQDHGSWIAALSVSTPQVAYLQASCYDPGDYAQITSTTAMGPNLSLWMYRAAPSHEYTGAAFTVVKIAGATYDWGLYLPLQAQDEGYKYPLLLKAPAGTAFVPATHAVDEWTNAGIQANLGADGRGEEYLWWENVAGQFIIRYSGCTEPWVYLPSGGAFLDAGLVTVESWGHSLAFNCAEIVYPVSSSATPLSTYSTPGWATDAHTFADLSYEPAGGSVSVGSVTGGANPSEANPDKPVLTFTSDGRARPVCFAVTQLHSPSLAAARSVPLALDGTKITMSARGYVTDSWRNATCDVTLRTGLTDTYLNYPNGKVTVNTGWAQYVDNVLDQTTARMFTGYVAGTEARRGGEDLNYAEITLNCADAIAARLDGKKKLLNHICYAGAPVAASFKHILNRCGFPDSLIDVTGVTVSTFPLADRYGDLLFDFRPDEDVTVALDTLSRSVGHVWGVNQNGVFFLRPRAAYSGTPDYTLTDDAVVQADMCYRLSAERGWDDFRNFVCAITGQGASLSSWITYNYDSNFTATSADFIGDDWWDVLVEPDADNPALLSQQRYAETFLRRQVIIWETAGRTDLWPGHFVKVQASGLDVPTDTIFRITAKTWAVEDSGQYTCTFTGLKVQ